MTTLESMRRGWLTASGMARAAFGDPRAWEGSIRRYESRDRVRPPAPGGIVFCGSSSFALWDDLEADLAPIQAINRGFGGALMRDVVRYADRVVLPYAPAAIVLFAGTNDVAWPKPAEPQAVADGFVEFLARIRPALPDALVYYVPITPTPARWNLWPIAAEANQRIGEIVVADPLLRLIDLTDDLIGADGLPIRDLYRSDGLHPNARGYEIWAERIRAALESEPRLAGLLGEVL